MVPPKYAPEAGPVKNIHSGPGNRSKKEISFYPTAILFFGLTMKTK